jgi:hypothetical protein
MKLLIRLSDRLLAPPVRFLYGLLKSLTRYLYGLLKSFMRLFDWIADFKHLGWVVAGLAILMLIIGLVITCILGPDLGDYCQVCQTQDGPRRVFTQDDAYNALTDFGPEGRKRYALLEVVDLAYPVAYGSFFALGIIYAFRRLFGRGNAAQLLALLALAGWLADWLENSSVLTMIAVYPNKLPALGQFLSFDSPIKWLLDILAGTLAIIGLILCPIIAFVKEETQAAR